MCLFACIKLSLHCGTNNYLLQEYHFHKSSIWEKCVSAITERDIPYMTFMTGWGRGGGGGGGGGGGKVPGAIADKLVHIT